MSMRYLAGFISAFYNPLKVPDAPTIGTATSPSSTTASITFTAPANVGGGAITGYVASARKTSNGTVVSTTGSSSPITVTGLTTGDAYTITVAAVNVYGPSLSSAASNSVTPLPAIGDAYQGGYYAGQIGVSSVATHNLVVAPASSGQTIKIWKNADTLIAGANSNIDGPQNTADMVADGNATIYPAAHFCNDAVIGGYSDWYMPAKNELEVCYYNLKPEAVNNNTSSGINPNAVPARASNYTAGTPAQTSAVDFKDTGTEDFSGSRYWSSTQFSATYACTQRFDSGTQYTTSSKSSNNGLRAVRRVAV